MSPSDKKAALAAIAIMVFVGGGSLLMPRILEAVGVASGHLGTAVAFLFLFAPFIILWLRARHQRRKNDIS